jgi:hypothetical protein
VNDVGQPVEMSIENVSIEEKQRRERLVLRGRRDVGIGGEAGQERCDFWLAHLVGMALAMKEDEPTNPAGIGLFGARAVVACFDCEANAIEKARRAGRSICIVAAGRRGRSLHGGRFSGRLGTTRWEPGGRWPPSESRLHGKRPGAICMPSEAQSD